ncbi:MAG TPA: hypothetical protein VFQ61_24430, partial [Polyangiaceae bacterium]|nr:hypothetical protein [Polyangiaceae bacterium]
MRVSRLLRLWIGPAVGSFTWLGCDREPPPAPAPNPTASTVQAGRPELPPELSPKTSGNGNASAASSANAASNSAAQQPATPAPGPGSWSVAPSFPADYKGTWFAVTALGAGVYVEPSFEAKKIGYLRSGSRVPVEAKPSSKKNCTGGWYALQSGGFICGNLGTTDM